MSEPPTTAADILARYAAGERDFHNANLRDADLYGAKLRYADLHYADLRDAD